MSAADVPAISKRTQRRAAGRQLVFDAAVARYLKGEPIELASLAAEAGVSRASAYRWYRGNDHLLAEVLRHRTDHNFARARDRHAHKTGHERVLSVLGDMLHHAARSERTRTLLDRHPQRTMAVLASGAYPNQRLAIARVETLLEEEVARGLELSVDTHSLAYTIVRIIESFIYADVIAGEPPDPDRALDIIRLLVTPSRVDTLDLGRRITDLQHSVDEIKARLEGVASVQAS
jgi:AcrR family transcriptional regulator